MLLSSVAGKTSVHGGEHNRDPVTCIVSRLVLGVCLEFFFLELVGPQVWYVNGDPRRGMDPGCSA